MLMRHSNASAGFTIIELMITLAVLGVLITLGLPSMSAWLQNTQIRGGAEGMISGLQLARAEALRRNASVRFQLVTDLTGGCALSDTGKSWVVSQTDPTALCDLSPSDTVAPQIVQKKGASEGSPNAAVTATGGNVAVFNGLGRLTGAGNITQIDIKNTQGGDCQKADGTGGPMRCLRIMVSTGGGIRMCDPIVTIADDPRTCIAP